MYGPKWQFLLGYGSRNTRCIDFPRVDELSTDTSVLGHHSNRSVALLGCTSTLFTSKPLIHRVSTSAS